MKGGHVSDDEDGSDDSDALALDATFDINLTLTTLARPWVVIAPSPQSGGIAALREKSHTRMPFEEERVQRRSWDKDKLPEQRKAPRAVMKEQRCKETKETIRKDEEKGKKVVGKDQVKESSRRHYKVFGFGASKEVEPAESSTKRPTQGSKATSSSNEAGSTFQFGGASPRCAFERELWMSHPEFSFKFSLDGTAKTEAQRKGDETRLDGNAETLVECLEPKSIFVVALRRNDAKGCLADWPQLKYGLKAAIKESWMTRQCPSEACQR
ncbi:hypothetical protein C8J56DRAFT_1027684 [Mycena floridula]|nr:hypothetical protein C8J56DRAFT_1027684 [Mycena floridula]